MSNGDQQHEFIGRVLAVQRACALMPGYRPFGCVDIAEKTGLPRNTAWRILKGLAYHKFIYETEAGDKFYRPR